jgi:hypothetical protein
MIVGKLEEAHLAGLPPSLDLGVSPSEAGLEVLFHAASIDPSFTQTRREEVRGVEPNWGRRLSPGAGLRSGHVSL